MNEARKNIPYEMFGDFAFRSPLMPLSFVDEVFQKGMYKVMDEHKSITDQAIFLASPNLHRKLEKRRKDQLKEDNLEFDLSIVKYLTRMATRCTPFGIFAGIGTGKVSEQSEIILADPSDHYSHTKLSQDFLYAYYATLCKDPEIEQASTYFTNNTLYRRGNRLRYTEYVDQGVHRKYTLSSVDTNDILVKICSLCVKGATWSEIVSRITEEGVSEEEAAAYIRILIRNCVLINALEPSPVSEDMLSDVIQNLCATIGDSRHYQFCSQLKNELQDVDSGGVGTDISGYRNIVRKLKKAMPEIKSTGAFHVDLGIQTVRATLSDGVLAEVYEGLEVLNRLTARKQRQFLSQFRQEFFRRYENEEIPLVEALDSESGIPLENSDSRDINALIEDIPVGGDQRNEYLEVNQQSKFLIEEYFNYLENHDSLEANRTLHLSYDGLLNLPVSWNDIPKTFAVMAEMIRNKKNENLLCLKTATGVNASKTLSRFHQVSPALNQLISEIYEKEKDLYGEAIVAEILHLPQPRVGNVLIRPEVCNYQIPIVTRSKKDLSFQIPVSDLMISVRNGQRIALRSSRLNKQIIPRLSTAHNFSHNSIPIYRFLCYLQMQDMRPDLTFQWPDLLASRPFLPRVRYRNVVLSPATWNVNALEIPADMDINSGVFHKRIRGFQSKHDIPDRVLLTRGDRKLLIDFRHLQSCQMFYSEIKSKPFVLKEFFMDAGESMIRDQKGHQFAGEYVFCFYQNQK